MLHRPPGLLPTLRKVSAIVTSSGKIPVLLYHQHPLQNLPKKDKEQNLTEVVLKAQQGGGRGNFIWRINSGAKNVNLPDPSTGSFSVQLKHYLCQPLLLLSSSREMMEAFSDCRAGHFRYFFIFSIMKNEIFAFFIKLITYFCTSPI